MIIGVSPGLFARFFNTEQPKKEAHTLQIELLMPLAVGVAEEWLSCLFCKDSREESTPSEATKISALLAEMPTAVELCQA